MLLKSFLILSKIKQIKKSIKLFTLFGGVVFPGCQYKFVSTNDQPTLELAFRGAYSSPSFQDEFLLELQRSTGYKVVSANGRYLVEIDTDRLRKETIGFVHDRVPLTGAVIDRLFPNEGRAVLGAKIRIIDKHHFNSMILDRRLFASSDFDFTNPNTLRDTFYEGTPLVEYSLGQFDSEYGAFDVAHELTTKKLAKKLALFLGGICLKK
jgi:hypothetical protein